MDALVDLVKGEYCAGVRALSRILYTLGFVAGEGWLYGIFLHTICGSFLDLEHLDVGVGEGGSIV